MTPRFDVRKNLDPHLGWVYEVYDRALHRRRFVAVGDQGQAQAWKRCVELNRDDEERERAASRGQR